jgi:subtilase family serine protease
LIDVPIKAEALEAALLAHNNSGEKMMIRKNCRLLPALALTLAMCIPSLAGAQGTQVVNPFIDLQGKPGKSINGLTPAQIRRAYRFDAIVPGLTQGSGQTIAVIDGFHDPNIESDLQTFSSQFNLPQLDCNSALGNGCLHRLYSCQVQPCYSSSNPPPPTDRHFVDPNSPYYQFWALEIALDIEWAHAIAPQANIVLVEVQANGCVTPAGFQCTAPPTSADFFDPTLDDLLGGVDVALNSPNKVSVVSMSWGGLEFSAEQGPNGEDAHFHAPNGVPHVTFFASAGDSGHGVIYPAASPYVMSVGGTRLNIDADGSYDSEKAWSGTGGGLSAVEPEPHFQSSYPIPNETNPPMRGTPDVGYNAAPATGVAVYDSVAGAYYGWSQVGGTSAGPPQWSGLFALANSLRHAIGKLPLTGSGGVNGNAVLYSFVQDDDGDDTFHDVSTGNDGNCGRLCKAKPGYDYLTGLGTPRANLLIPTLVAH